MKKIILWQNTKTANNWTEENLQELKDRGGKYLSKWLEWQFHFAHKTSLKAAISRGEYFAVLNLFYSNKYCDVITDVASEPLGARHPGQDPGPQAPGRRLLTQQEVRHAEEKQGWWWSNITVLSAWHYMDLEL